MPGLGSGSPSKPSTEHARFIRRPANDVFCNVEEFNYNDDLEEGFRYAQRWSEIIEGFAHYCLMKTHSHCVVFLDTVKGTSYPSEMC